MKASYETPQSRLTVLSDLRRPIMERIAKLARLPTKHVDVDPDLEMPLMCEDGERREPEEAKSLPLTPGQGKFDLSATFIRILPSVGAFLIPSFVYRFQRCHNPNPSSNISETTYLNGVRGLASLLVYIQHIATDYGDWIHYGYGSRQQDIYFVQLPFVRLLYSGRFMVAVFFILSGYVLSYKPLQLSRKQDTGLLFDNLTSAVFRRAPRLFLPVLPVMLLTGVFGNYYGCFGEGHPMEGRCLQRQPNLWAQILLVWGNFAAMLNPFTWAEFYPQGVPQLWTLPMEFRGSIVVFMLVLCFGNTKPALRMLFLLTVAYYCVSIAHWDTFLFICGVIMAELRILRKEVLSSYLIKYTNANARVRTTLRILKLMFWISVLILALFIGSWPAYGASVSPGFKVLCSYTPSVYASELLQQYFWISIAALLLLLALEHFEPLQRPFTSALAIYAGDISFGLYIVHWPLLLTFGRGIFPSMIKIFSKEGADIGFQNYPVGWWIGAMIFTPIVVWVADIHWRGADIQSVKFARWLFLVCAKKNGRT